MSFVKIDRNNFELISLLLKPSVHFLSSSTNADFSTTGSQFVSPVRSKCIKQVIDLEASFNNLRRDVMDGDSNVSKYNIDNFARAVSLYEAQTLAATSKYPKKASITLHFSGTPGANGEYIRIKMYGDAAAEQHDLVCSSGTASRSTSWTNDGDNTYSATLGISDSPTDETIANALVTLFSSNASYTAFKGGTAGSITVTITADSENKTLNITDAGTSVTNLTVGTPVGGVATDSPPHELTGSLERYMDLVPSAPKDVRFDKQLDIFRFDPPFSYTNQSTVKNVIRNIMMPEHRHRYENCGFWYSNYNTLNFFGVSGSDGEVIPTGSCLIYPNVNNCYGLEDEFSLNFWINPRYSKLTDRGDYRAGTIYHMPTQMAVSLVSGSDIDVYGEPASFKIMLQLTSSADFEPSKVGLSPVGVVGGVQRDLIFTASTPLLKNHWHHVCVQWSANSNNRTGSIFIDENETYFGCDHASIGSSSAVPDSYGIPSPTGLTIGNFYFGNLSDNSKLFHQNVTGSAHNLQIGSEGVIALDTTSPPGNPDGVHTGSMFTHPLQAEVHDIRLYDTYYDRGYGDTFGAKLRFESPKADLSNLKLWVPPYFFPDTPVREVLLTPFQKSPGIGNAADRTADPFNVQFSFGVGGKLINLENFVRDFAQDRNPRLLFLTASAITSSIQDITADQYVYEAHYDPTFAAAIDVGYGPFPDSGGNTGPSAPYPTGSLIKRNMTILPCDNGLFTPHYDVLEKSYMSGSDLFKKPNGVSDYSIISLERMIPTASLYPGLIFEGGSIFEDICGTAPDNPGVAPGSVLTIAQRTRDVSSNEISVYDISNLYYGNRIHPTSFEMYDENLTGSQGNISIRLRDNGRGNIYRADALTKHAEWNSVGNILYEEGIVVIKSPHLFYFCKDKTDIKFKGEQSIHTMIVNIPANEWNFTSSSNKTYTPITPTTGANDSNLKAVYITGVNIHDDNFNIIAKANFAQPIVKTEEDEFIIRLKQDF